MCAVAWKSLEELGDFYGGLSGKSKDDFQDGNAKFVTYMNVYSNMSLDFAIVDMVKVGKEEKQNSIKYGDILFTGSSETPDDCGMSCVVTDYVDEPIYLNSFCFGFRFDNIDKLEPNFLKHYFRCLTMRKAISLTASGVTRFNVSKKRFGKIQIPLLAISKQKEIAKHLDTFPTLISNLESELDMRRKQYEHYRNQLYGDTLELLLDKAKRGEIEISTLSEVGTFTRGRRFVRTDIMTEGTPCIHYGDMYTYYGVSAKSTLTYLLPEVAVKLRFAQENDVVIVGAGENNEDIGIGVAWLGQDDVAVHDACYIFKHQMNPLYISYYLRTDIYHKQIKKHVSSGKICSISSDGIGKAIIPVPSLETQQAIVEKLDAFEQLIQSLETEIKLRKQQYEYYREKLLTFE